MRLRRGEERCLINKRICTHVVCEGHDASLWSNISRKVDDECRSRCQLRNQVMRREADRKKKTRIHIIWRTVKLYRAEEATK